VGRAIKKMSLFISFLFRNVKDRVPRLDEIDLEDEAELKDLMHDCQNNGVSPFCVKHLRYKLICGFQNGGWLKHKNCGFYKKKRIYKIEVFLKVKTILFSED